MNAVGTKELHTPRLTLRKICAADTESLFECGCLGDSLEDAQRSVQKMIQCCNDPMNFHWVMDYQSHSIGRIKAWDISLRDNYAQLGYEIGAAFRSKGLMTEAVRAVCSYMLTEAGFNRLYCTIRENNLPSIRVCEKAGMTFDGIMRKHFKQSDGIYTDVRIYSILASEILPSV